MAAEPRQPTWEGLLRALAATREQGFELVQVSTMLPGEGFEVVTVMVRRGAGAAAGERGGER